MKCDNIRGIFKRVYKMKKAKIKTMIEEKDGPTAVFYANENQKKPKYKKIIFGICAILVVLALSINLIAASFFNFSLFKKDGSKDFAEYSYGEQLAENYEWTAQKAKEIQIENADGKFLNAIQIKNENISHSYIIICHRYGESPETMEKYAKHFYDLGFNIILPYLRGHGESPYKKVSMGWKDSADIVDWVNSIIEKDEKARIALFGVSMGANAVTLAAAEDLPENVRFVISDGCYTSLEELIKEYIKNETSLSSLLTTEFVSLFAENLIGVSLKDADTIKKLEEIRLPIMFINGENDEVVPPLVSKKLYENCDAEGVEEVIIEDGTHGRNMEADEESYWSHIDTFILNNLGI